MNKCYKVGFHATGLEYPDLLTELLPLGENRNMFILVGSHFHSKVFQMM